MCDNFWDMVPLGKNFDKESWSSVILNYLWEVRKNKWFRLILAKILHICNFIKNELYHGRSLCNFQNFSKFLENLSAGSGFDTFKLCTFIVILGGCFHLIFLKPQWIRNLEIWTKINFSYYLSLACFLLLLLFHSQR